jgi:hypothetical protein
MGHIALLAPDDAQAELCRELGEAFRFAALLYWPGQERRQKEAVATWAATVMGLWDEGFENLPGLVDSVLERRAAAFGLTPEELRATPRIRDLLAEMRSPAGQRQVEETREGLHRGLDHHAFRPAGGFLRVSAAPGLSVLAAEQWRAAQGPEAMCGTILLVLAAAERHHAQDLASVSLNRVMRALEDLGQVGKAGHSIRWMKDAWARTRGAHLWAAFLAAVGGELQGAEPAADAIESILIQPQRRAEVLAFASWFRQWGATFTPKGAAHPLFRRHALVPIQAAPMEPPLPPLPAELLRRLAAYRAPKDI